MSEYITEEKLEQVVRILRKEIRAKQAIFQAHTETLTGNKTLTIADKKLQFLDPNGASKTITLPAEALSKNLIFFFFNLADAAEDLVIEDDSSSTIITISQDEAGIVSCDGTVWKGLIGATT